VSPSASVAPTGVQVKVEASVALVGVRVALDRTGALFVTVAVSKEVSVPPSASVAVAVQVIVSPVDAIEAVKVTLATEPILVEPFVHA
jgi:hypothetical protein